MQPQRVQNDHNLVYDGFAVRNQKAPLLRRMGAYITDIGIITSILYLAVLIMIPVFGILGAGVIGALDGDASTGGQVFLIFMIILAVIAVLSIYSGYFIWNELKKGTTPGKRIFGLRVVSIDGKPLTFGQAMVRDLMRLVDCQLILPGFLAIRMNEDGRRLGDMVAGTMVVYSKSQEQESEFIYLPQETYLYYFERLSPQPVNNHEAEGFLHYAFAEFISGNPIDNPTLVKACRELCQSRLQVPPELQMSQHELELFFAEYCNQTMSQLKGA